MNNQNIFLPFSATSRIPRDLSYLLQESGWLMYHELAHASDFVPVSVRGTLNSALSPWGNICAALRRPPAAVRPDSALQYPLTSAQMKALAEIKFVTGPVSDTTLVNGIPYSTLKVVLAERRCRLLRGGPRDRRIQLHDRRAKTSR